MDFKCRRCGCEQSLSGRLGAENAGWLIFVPDEDDRPFLSLARNQAKISVTMCRECGLVDLTGDVDKIRSLAET